MEVLHTHCCGMDIHKKSITACVITPQGKQTRTFGTMTSDLFELLCWILQQGCTIVAMESTGVYWKPIYNLFELQDGLEVLVVNAEHIKAVPGRKTDVKDAEWIAELLRHGLLKGSFIPSRDQRELRELIRYRMSLTAERSREVNRLQKVLEGCNIKLSSVLTDITGVSGRTLLEAVANGEQLSPEQIDLIVKGRARAKLEEVEQSLNGLVGEHQRMMLKCQLKHIDCLNEQIEAIDTEVGTRLLPVHDLVELLDTITGVGETAAQVILAEIGTDMDRFPSEDHLSSWAGMCPGNNESAGKRKSGKTTKGNKTLRTTLVQSARAAARSKNTYLSSQYHRIAARRGANRAAVAVGHSILVIAYHIIKNKVPYQELGANYHDELQKTNVTRNTVKRLEALGYKVTLEPVA